jgi:uncharacterized membrane protein YtjA (UPF0391 family)
MLGISILFLILAVGSALLGFAGLVTGALVGIAKVLFFLFLVLWLVTMFTGRRRRNLI